VNWANVLSLAQGTVDKYPDVPLGWMMLGDVYNSSGMIQEAISAYRQAITLRKQQDRHGFIVEAWAALGSIYKKLQQPAQAQYAFSQVAAGQEKFIEQPSLEVPTPQGLEADKIKELSEIKAMGKSLALADLAGYYAGAGDSEHAKTIIFPNHKRRPAYA